MLNFIQMKKKSTKYTLKNSSQFWYNGNNKFHCVMLDQKTQKKNDWVTLTDLGEQKLGNRQNIHSTGTKLHTHIQSPPMKYPISEKSYFGNWNTIIGI